MRSDDCRRCLRRNKKLRDRISLLPSSGKPGVAESKPLKQFASGVACGAVTKRNRTAAVLLALTLPLTIIAWTQPGALQGAREFAQRLKPKRTVADVLAQSAASNRIYWVEQLKPAGLRYPPRQLRLVCLKEERRLEVYATSTNDVFKVIGTFPILAVSGGPGPKLREGDLQVPEGLYGIESLNPNSRFHLALRIGYPNDFDRRTAAAEGRTNLGGDIMIHGSNVSIGCLAMGDIVAEKLFVLAADTGINNVRVLMCPRDFRISPPNPLKQSDPKWLKGVYQNLAVELHHLPSAPSPQPTGERDNP